MFFKNKIKSINSNDLVLEIGPGATPHPRSNVFLEKKYDTEEELIAQSGHVGLLQTEKKVVYYDGNIFPFEDKEFDYVICSHVLEHVINPEIFIMEIVRVGKKGYIEFPTIYYEYLYNFPEHLNYLLYKDKTVKWLSKEGSSLSDFDGIQTFNRETLKRGYNTLIKENASIFVQGFEWFDTIGFSKASKIEDLFFSDEINRVLKDPMELDYSSLSTIKFFSAKFVMLLNRFKRKFGI
ncbi:methyltransferase domain-containing protein [Algoriphagus aquimarinus]|uniref:Methyltransferase domain-containing protein n=1 Tax=Algoriphagus aquimarinus TaxID=237018 RepID=A0A1I1CGP4_9BACT|nr:methyltransferase domain-containing protein [Algoriphagus aquimarinus]SFB60068.1 Methyltransferase domain-containing protein [Algoriphagus aquimarinus]